jgi:Tfp pilus assembly protein PilP
MKKHPIAILTLVVSFLFLSACAEEQVGQQQQAAVDVKAAAVNKTAAVSAPAAAQPAAPKPEAGAKPPAGQAAAQAPNEPVPPLVVPEGYSYQPRGRRDPFVNPVKPTVDEGPSGPVIRPDGLPGVLVSEVKLSGIVYSPVQTMKKAMLVVGRSTYFAKQGDSLFDGVIKEIRPNEVVFAMVSTTTKQPVNRETVVRTGGSSVTLAGEK